MAKVSVKDWLDLTRAGYTPDEIRAYETEVENTPTVEEQPEKLDPGGTIRAETDVENTPTVEEQPKEEPKAVEQTNETKEMLLQIIGMMQKSNINNNGMKNDSTVDPVAAVASILMPKK